MCLSTKKGGGRRVYRRAHSKHPDSCSNLRFFFSPFGWWILWWAASSTRAAQPLSNICSWMQPSLLSFDRRPVLRHGLHSTPLVSPSSSSVVASGLGWGADSHMTEAWGLPTITGCWISPTCRENKGSRLLGAQHTSDAFLEVTICFWRNDKIFGQQ